MKIFHRLSLRDSGGCTEIRVAKPTVALSCRFTAFGYATCSFICAARIHLLRRITAIQRMCIVIAAETCFRVPAFAQPSQVICSIYYFFPDRGIKF